MNPATAAATHSDTSSLPLARIIAQDKAFVFPLREYLEAHGCRVVINSESQADATYTIVCGDMQFVKDWRATVQASGGRVLVAIVDIADSEDFSIDAVGVKVVLLDPVAISSNDVRDIFSHFFSGKQQALDKRRNRHVHGKNSAAPVQMAKQVPVLHIPLYEKKSSDTSLSYDDIFSSTQKKRIDSLISDIFAPVEKKPHAGGRPRQTKTRVFWGIVLAVVIWMVPAIWYLGGIAATATAYAWSSSAFAQQQVSRAQWLRQVGEYWLTQSSLAFGVVKMQWAVLGVHEVIRGQERLLSFFHDTRRVFEHIDEVQEVAVQIQQGLLAKKEGADSLVFEMNRLQVIVAALNSSLGLAQAQLETMQSAQSFPFAFPWVARRAADVRTTIVQLRVAFSYADRLLALYPKISGFDEPKTYLVLLQNSTELRPTGGFIGSVGKVTFVSGAMSDFTIQDVYVLDGQLKGHVDPPSAVAQLLAQEHWYLRDSNWDPDFRNSAAQAAWFYEKEAGEQVDGVIALSLPLVVDLLRVTGPIVLSDYNEQISAENFFGKSLYYTKNNFFPGSTQKSDFLGTLARTLVLQLTTQPNVQAMELFEVLASGLSRRDIMMWFPDAAIQQIAEHFGWAGAVVGRVGCEGVVEDACVFAPVAINEANVSVSKVNAFVNRQVLREIDIAQNGVLTEQTTVTLNNTSQAEDPGVSGAYKTYVRFMLPLDASVHEVTIDGVLVPSRSSTQQAASLPYIERVAVNGGMQGVAVALEVPVVSSRSVSISYTRGMSLWGTGSDAVLDVFSFKQPGVGSAMQSVVVRFPAFWRVENETVGVPVTNPALRAEDESEARVLANEGQFEYNTTVLTDSSVRLRFFR